MKRGFTLIEMAVVLFIVALVAPALMTYLTATLANAQNSAVKTNMTTIQNGIAWSAMQSRVCVPPSVSPCNAATYTYTLPAVGSTIQSMGFSAQVATDPWGNPYIYTAKNPVINPGLAPGVVAFTITSNGPDGVAATPDDRLLTVFVLDLESVFAKF